VTENADRLRYVDAVHAEYASARIWDYLRYDEAGDLWINDLRVSDALVRYGAPLEIVDTTIIQRRCHEWEALCRGVAADEGYGGRLRFLYAAKANMASEVAGAAYRSGWGAECSSRQDLMHLQWLRAHGLLPEGVRVVCNGFKLPASRFTLPMPRPPAPAGTVVLPPGNLAPQLRQMTYAATILSMARAGWDIVPVLDQGEVPGFAGRDGPPMDVGLRMKLGRADSRQELAGLVSRFGMDQPTLLRTADAVARSGNLRLVALHGMVGAAETIPADQFVKGLLLAADSWVKLKRQHASLVEINVGGGMPPLSEPYDSDSASSQRASED
jgi:diaminopimelate decarboxylase